MCQFCTQHGEGGKWYQNMANYTEAVFREVNSAGNLTRFLQGFSASLRDGVATASRWQRRFPRIYRLLAYPLLSRRMQKTHFGQVVPLEEVEAILDQVEHIVRLPCVCRRVTLGREQRYCFGVGMDLTPILREVPDFAAFEYWGREQTKAFIRRLDQEGKSHSVWTFNTPYIGAICNCDQDCMAYRAQISLGVTRTIWKGEYVAEIDPLACTGCKLCRKRCSFDAMGFDQENKKCVVDAATCYGCGVCRPACQHGAIRLLDRAAVPAAAESW